MLAPSSYILLTKRISEEDNQFVATCDDLGIATCGKTLQDAGSHLDEAIELLLNSLTKMGEIEPYLKDKGIEIYQIAKKDRAVKQFSHVSLKEKEWLTPSRVPLPA